MTTAIATESKDVSVNMRPDDVLKLIYTFKNVYVYFKLGADSVQMRYVKVSHDEIAYTIRDNVKFVECRWAPGDTDNLFIGGY